MTQARVVRKDQRTGKYRRTRPFVLTLGYSRKAVRLLIFRSSSHARAELQETGFRQQGEAAVCRILGVLALAKK